MPSIELAYVNVALNIFGCIIALIIFSACLGEKISSHTGSTSFLCLLVCAIVALLADSLGWTCEGYVHLSVVTVIANTIASCAGQMAVLCFMTYLCQHLYDNSRSAKFILNIFRVLCCASLLYCIGNAFFGYAFVVNDTGHYVHAENGYMVVVHLLFSIASFITLILMALFATSTNRASRVGFIIYTLFPIAGIVADYTVHGIALTYVSIVVSIMVIYTSIYLQRQKMIDEQANALMLSQINPHFTYNTLTTIAAMCDMSPKLAKSLTIDFSHYLRHNLDSVRGGDMIPFGKELEHVECYLKIEKARFREKLNVVYSIQSKDFLIPPLTVQPLVENAVKHGITQKINGGTLKISTYSTDKHHVIEIIDDGAGFDTETSDNSRRHVGLENVNSRVKRMCRGSVSIKSIVDVGTRVTIEIPRKKGDKA